MWPYKKKEEIPEVLITAKNYDKALAFCNERRAEYQMEPWTALPPGRRGHPGECPCSHSVPNLVVKDTVYYYDVPDSHFMKFHGIADFILEFDGADALAIANGHPNYNQLALPVRMPENG